MRTGLNVAVSIDGPQTHRDIVEEVRAAADLGLASAWWPQLPPLAGVTPWDALTSIAATGVEVPAIDLGAAVVVTRTLHPLVIAGQALTAQAATGGRLTLGIGPSHAGLVEATYGIPAARPAQHVAEVLEVLGPALQGEPIDLDGEQVTAHGVVALPAVAPPALLVAALGPQMLAIAGRFADGTVTTWAGRRALADHVVPLLTASAAAAGRPAPQVVANLPVVVTTDPETARRRVDERFGMAATLPSYRRMFDLDGHVGPGDAVIAGDEDSVARQVADLADAGVSELIATVLGDASERERTVRTLAALGAPTV